MLLIQRTCDLVTSIQIWKLSNACNFSISRSESSDFTGGLFQCAYTYRHTDRPIHTYNISLREKEERQKEEGRQTGRQTERDTDWGRQRKREWSSKIKEYNSMLNISRWLRIARCSTSVGGSFFIHQIKDSDSMSCYDMISSVILIFFSSFAIGFI